MAATEMVDATYMRPVGTPDQVSFVYDGYPQGVYIYAAATGTTQTLASLPQGAQPSTLVALMTYPPSQWVAYTYERYGAQYQIQTGLVMGLAGQSFTEVLSLDASHGYALLPLLFESDPQGQPTALWVTRRLFGIGNVMVAPSKGLWRVDLANLQPTQVLPEETNGNANHIVGVSPTGQWAAYWREDDPGHVHIIAPGQGGQERLLNTVSAVANASCIGYGVFSADGRYVAWEEYTGSFDTGYQGHFALYDLNTGHPLAVGALPAAQTYATPVAWLDSHTLLLSGVNGSDPAVFIWDIQSQNQPTFVSGVFLGVEH